MKINKIMYLSGFLEPTVPFEDPSTDPPLVFKDPHHQLKQEIAEEKQKFIVKKKAEKEAEEGKKKEDLLNDVPHESDAALQPGGGEPSDLETIKRRSYIKKVCTLF